MLVYLSTLALTMLFAWQLQRAATIKKRYGCGGRRHWVWLLLLLAVLGIVAGLRNGVGTDYGNYIDSYLLARDKPYAVIWTEWEPLYGTLNRACADLFDSYIPVFVLSALLPLGLILGGIYQNSSHYLLSLFLFITGMYYFDLFNGIRQMIAAAILFAAYPLVKRRKWLWLAVITLIACQFHAVAIVVPVVCFLAHRARPHTPLLGLSVGGFVLIYLLYDVFVANLIRFLTETGLPYSIYGEWLMAQDQGAHVLRFALAAVPPLLGLLFWRQLRAQREDAHILLYLSVVNALLMLIATKNWIFARLSMFFGLYNVLLWPELLKCFDKKSRTVMLVGVITVYFVYFWLIVHTDSNLLPYRSWLFGGVYD